MRLWSLASTSLIVLRTKNARAIYNVLTYPNKLGQRELEFSGVLAQVGVGADEPFMSEIGTLLLIALCGRNSL